MSVPRRSTDPAERPILAAPHARGRSDRLGDALLAALFVAVLLLPGIGLLAGGEPRATSEDEKRELASFPVWSWAPSDMATWPDRFQQYFDDRFGFRRLLIGWRARLLWNTLGTSASEAVIAGRDRWLFYADDGGIEDATGEAAISDEQLSAWRETVQRTNRWLAGRSSGYVFTVAPDKHVIYPDFLPSSLHRVRRHLDMDRLLATLDDLGVAVDLRPALLVARTRERVYHRTDTHWNERGAFAAYQTLIDAVRRQHPAVPPAWARTDFTAEAREVAGMDLAGMLGLARTLREDNLLLVPLRPRLALIVEPAGAPLATAVLEGRLVTEIPGSTLPRAIVFRDSFTSALIPFLSEHFSRTVYLWQQDFDANEVIREQPDVVIQEIVGRKLHTFIPSPELVPSE